MDRRKVLKSMGLAMGYTVATPTLISIMQSCKGSPVIEWTPSFFTKDEGTILTKLVDIILPATDTPAASELQVHIFIDKFANEVMDKEKQDFFKMSMNKFLGKALKATGKEKASDLSTEELEAQVASKLKISKEQQSRNEEAIVEYMKTTASGDGASLNDDTAAYAFISNLRSTTIWGYKTSEYVGEKVLAYLPIPGEYIACGDLQELTDGKVWSL